MNGVIGMELLELFKKRYSCRGFEKREVEQEKIDMIMEAAAVAPTAVNKQPQRILVLRGEELKKVDECTRFGFDAPLNFLICYDKEQSWHRRSDNADHGMIDSAIVHTHMMLMAESLGLGTTWVCAFDEPKARELFNVPDNYVIEGFMPTGYPAAEPSEMHFKRKPVNEIFFDKF